MHLQKVVDPIHGRVTFLGMAAENGGEEAFLKAVLEGYYGRSSFTIEQYVAGPNGEVMRHQNQFLSPELMAIIEANRNMEGGDENIS